MAAGTGVMEKAAAEGMKLFAQETAAEFDTAGAEKYKAEVDEQIAALDVQVAQLTGKDNKKERTAKSKEVADLKVQPKYIDACKVAKGLEPKNGNFIMKAAEVIKPAASAAPAKAAEPEAPKEEKKEEKKKPKKEESTGISKAERDELEKLKTDIIERKTQLKAEGMSGGQQNKDPQIVEWVTRMNELKEKESPGSTKDAKKEKSKKASKAPLSPDEQKELDGLIGEIDTYKHKLKTEFGYTNKDIKADEELKEMEARLAALEKRGN